MEEDTGRQAKARVNLGIGHPPMLQIFRIPFQSNKYPPVNCLGNDYNCIYKNDYEHKYEHEYKYRSKEMQI